jgi:hypothetical protein
MHSLRELQAQFASALLATEGGQDERIAVYRNTIRANYRNALGATYPVVRQLVGAPFFDTAVDAYVAAHASTGGDLNVYGHLFARFLEHYPHARELSYLPDVARLEWAVDEAGRAADSAGTPEAILSALAALPPDRVTAQRFVLDASCRFLVSAYPVYRIWEVHQPAFAGAITVDFDAGSEWLLVRRDQGMVVVERQAAGDFAWLEKLDHGGDLAEALGSALAADPHFDLGTTLRACIASGTIAALRSA